MVSLTFYGGVNEIGGNKIQVQEGKNKIFLDFGMSFSQYFTFFDNFLPPRKLNGMGDFFEVGLLPRLTGIYRYDYLKHMGMKEEALDCDGVFITHAHADHMSFVHFLREDLPIYGTPETLKIMESVEETSATGWCEFSNLKKTFEFYKNTKGGLSRLQGEKARVPRKKHIMEKPVQLDSMKITSSRVNHSLPGATAYLVETKGGTIAYTGDLRFHGYGGHLTEKFVKEAAGADVLITEGTRVGETGTLTEEQVLERVKKEIERTEGIVLANWPIRDTDRLTTFFNAAKEDGRLLAINPKQANLLEKLSQVNPDVPKPTDKNIRIFVTRKSWGLIDREVPYPELKEGDYEGWECEFLNWPNMIDYRELRKNPSQYVVRTDFYDLTELIDIQPNEKAKYIRSVCEPFDEKMEFNEAIVDAWLNHFKVRKSSTIHCSGHAPGPDIERIVEEIKPKLVIPVHTEKASRFEELGVKCKIPEYGKEMKT